MTEWWRRNVERKHRYEIVGRFVTDELLNWTDNYLEARMLLRAEIRRGACSEYWICDTDTWWRYDLKGRL